MGMTMTQKILAAHAGLDRVEAGQLINAKLDLVLGNDITTPVAVNEFQKAGFDKKRIFYTQGDYGLFQCTKPCCKQTWDNEESIRRMILAQGFEIGEHHELILPEGKAATMTVPSGLLPVCPNCGQPLTMNLRSDDRFVEDAGWQKAAVEYEKWVTSHQNTKTLWLEIGVGYNTPGIIKYNFWQQVYQNEQAAYVCLNYEEQPVPEEIRDRSVMISGDSDQVIGELVS